MDADFTAGPGDSRSARQPGYRLTHPDTSSPGTSPNPVLTGIDTGGHGGPGRNGQDPAAQWSAAPVTLRTPPESEGLPRRLAPDLPQRTADPEAVAARLAAEGEPFGARITTDREPFAVPSPVESFGSQPGPGESLYARTRPTTASFTRVEPESEPFAVVPAPELGSPAEHAAVNGSPFGARIEIDEEVSVVTPAVEVQAPVGRRYAPDPEPVVHPDAPARLERLEAVAASLRDSIEEATAVPQRPASVPSRRRAAPEPAPEPAAAPADSTPSESKAAEFRASDASIDLHHIMRLLTASHDLEVAAQAAESGAGSVAELTEAAHRTRAAAVEIVAAWYGGSDHMRKFGEVLLQAAAESSPASP
ncbi:hypothetical protein [Nocardia seriolae]|nr:hypothetical protein [Nocardia seriolae]MTJ60691.1 hypothetical protein [Nocardia seriolae]MTJ76033.1 hypothetical protein [Nocardia seriolae]MTJ91161.1 hypothetical protein [Nocardia seriolae]MTK35122.1 hypothetical protein [Nocardia seriolae]MTK38680.1 hypothetical protein [Nocardia seriolae]